MCSPLDRRSKSGLCGVTVVEWRGVSRRNLFHTTSQLERGRLTPGTERRERSYHEQSDVQSTISWGAGGRHTLSCTTDQLERGRPRPLEWSLLTSGFRGFCRRSLRRADTYRQVDCISGFGGLCRRSSSTGDTYRQVDCSSGLPTNLYRAQLILAKYLCVGDRIREIPSFNKRTIKKRDLSTPFKLEINLYTWHRNITPLCRNNPNRCEITYLEFCFFAEGDR